MVKPDKVVWRGSPDSTGMIWVVVKIMVPLLGTLNIRCRIIMGTQKRDHNFDNHPYEKLQCFSSGKLEEKIVTLYIVRQVLFMFEYKVLRGEDPPGMQKGSENSTHDDAGKYIGSTRGCAESLQGFDSQTVSSLRVLGTLKIFIQDRQETTNQVKLLGGPSSC